MILLLGDLLAIIYQMLLKTIVDHIAEFDFTEEVFNIVAEQQKKNYYNEMLTPFNLAK